MTTTPDLTAEQIEAVAKALREDTLLCHMDGSAVPFDELAEAALTAAGLLVGDPTEEQIERAAEALAAWDGFEWSGDWEGTVSRDAYRNGATLALSAAGVAPQESGAHAKDLPTSPGRMKNEADSSHVAPQEPHGDYHEGLEEGIKIGRSEMKLDPEKVAEVINRLPWGYMVDGPSVDEIARALCEAAKRGELG